MSGSVMATRASVVNKRGENAVNNMKKRIYAIESASMLIFVAVLTAACGPSPKDETTGSYLDDATVTGRVKAAIALNSLLSSLDIRVETDKPTKESCS
jgi:hypothetical protein